jgi:hypothetical protein
VPANGLPSRRNWTECCRWWPQPSVGGSLSLSGWSDPTAACRAA